MPALVPTIGVLAVVPRGDTVLLARRANPPDEGLWGFPGGRLESGESLAQAAARELLEETGVTAEFTRSLEVFEVIRRDAAERLEFHYVLVPMVGRWIAGEPAPGIELLDVAWMTVRMIARVPSSSETARLAAAVLSPQA
jgi:ADP-ribose pyrophosphatase YjhB (NUDIX family)